MLLCVAMVRRCSIQELIHRLCMTEITRPITQIRQVLLDLITSEPITLQMMALLVQTISLVYIGTQEDLPHTQFTEKQVVGLTHILICALLSTQVLSLVQILGIKVCVFIMIIPWLLRLCQLTTVLIL